MGGNRGGSSRNMYKGHMDKAKGNRIEWGVGKGGMGGLVGGGMERTVFEQQQQQQK